MSWTDERIDRLKAMWAEGSTASQIAEGLGGVSRNAVIGKAHRLGLESRPSPVRPGEEKGKKAKNAAAATPVAAPKPDKHVPSKAEEPRPAPKPAAPAVEARSAPRPAAPEAIPAAGPVPRPGAKEGTTIQYRSVGPGGFIRQGPGDTQAPIPPAPPRRLVPAKPNVQVAAKTGLLDLNDRICRWPMGHPGEPDFHFCGQQSNPGYPYCVDHCGVAYQAQLPRRDRRPPPPLPFGGPRVR